MAKLKKDKKQRGSNSIFSFKGSRFRNGSFSAAMIVIAIALVIVVNLVVSKLPAKYTEVDVSGNNLYSIGKESKKLLHNMDQDVTIYYLLSASAESTYAELTKLLENYKEESGGKIKIVKKDPELYPNFGTKYNATQNTALIVESKKRYKTIDGSDMYTVSNSEDAYYYGEDPIYTFNGEGLIANAIDYVTTDSLPKVYELAGNGEVKLDDNIKNQITNANISVEELNLLTTGKVPDDADCLMIISPESDFSRMEKDAILKYLKKGGNAIIIPSNYYEKNSKHENLDEVLKAYGVKIENGIVVERNKDYISGINNSPIEIVPDTATHSITQNMKSSNFRCYMPSAQSIKTLDNIKDTLKVKSLLTTSTSSYLKSNINTEQSSGSYEKEDGDATGPFDVAVAITDSKTTSDSSDTEGTSDTDTEEDEKNIKTKLVVFGTSSIIDESVYKMDPYNVSLFTASLGWICDRKDSITITAKNQTESKLSITSSKVTNYAVLYLAVIPIAVLGSGIVITIRRRKR